LHGSKIKPGPISKLKTIKRAMGPVLSQHRHYIKIQNTHIETLSVEEIVNIQGL
jgi:hypothetical protein